jgi:hypothetical protein
MGSAQGPQYHGTKKKHAEEGRWRENTVAQTPLPTRGQMFTKPLPGGRSLEIRKQNRPASTSTHPFQIRKRGGLNISIRPGAVRSSVPTNMNVLIEVPPNSTDGYFVWLRTDRTGDHYTNGVSVQIGHGATLPEPPSSSGGLPPAWTVHPIGYVTSAENAIDSVSQIVFNNGWIKEVVAESCTETEYDLEWIFGADTSEPS